MATKTESQQFKELVTNTKKIAAIDKHLKDYDKGVKSLVAKNNSDLCALYEKWGPVLKFAAGLLFFKKNWQKGFRIFIQAIETNCDLEPVE